MLNIFVCLNYYYWIVLIPLALGICEPLLLLSRESKCSGAFLVCVICSSAFFDSAFQIERPYLQEGSAGRMRILWLSHSTKIVATGTRRRSLLCKDLFYIGSFLVAIVDICRRYNNECCWGIGSTPSLTVLGVYLLSTCAVMDGWVPLCDSA